MSNTHWIIFLSKKTFNSTLLLQLFSKLGKHINLWTVHNLCPDKTLTQTQKNATSYYLVPQLSLSFYKRFLPDVYPEKIMYEIENRIDTFLFWGCCAGIL